MEVEEALQVGFADDLSDAGHAGPNAQCIRFLVDNVPQYGYFPEEEKSIYICKGGEEVAHATFADIRINTLIYGPG